MASSLSAEFISKLSQKELSFNLIRSLGFKLSETGVFEADSNIDGLHDAVSRLDKLVNTFEFLKNSLPKNTLLAIEDLAQASHLLPVKLSSRNRDNVLSGRLHVYPILSVFTQRVTALEQKQSRVIYVLQAILLYWWIGTANQRHESKAAAPNKITKLCQKIRNYSKTTLHPITWPPLALSEEELISVLFNKDCEIGKLFDLPEFLILHFGGKPNETISNSKSILITSQQSHQTRFRQQERVDELQPRGPIITKRYKIQDVELITDIYEEDAHENSTRYLSFHERVARLASTQFISEMDNQFLPYAWEFLNPVEQISTIKSIKEDSSSGLRTLAILMIATSLDCKRLFSARIVDAFNEESSDIQIRSDLACWFAKFPSLSGKFRKKPVVHDFLEPIIEGLRLPLPSEIRRKNNLPPNSHLGEALSYDSPEAMQRALEQYCHLIRSDSNNRLTPFKLRSMMFASLIMKTSDEVKTGLAINNDEFSPSIAFYYTSFESDELEDLVKNSLIEMGLSVDEDPLFNTKTRYGSELFWSSSEHKKHLEQVTRFIIDSPPINNSSRLTEIIEHHNQYAAYIAWMLHCSTGHRERNVLTIDSQSMGSDWLLVNDKVKEYENPRLVKISDELKTQFHYYKEHLVNLSRILKLHDSELAKKIGSLSMDLGRNLDSIPYFFYLENTDKINISSISTKSIFETLRLPSDLPRNIQRHWYVTGLRQQGLPAEWILSSSGHCSIGQIPYSSTSLFPIRRFGDSWNKQIDQWLYRLGFTALPSRISVTKGQIPKLSEAQLVQEITQDQLNTRPAQVRIEQIVNEEINKYQNLDLSDNDQFRLFIEELTSSYQWNENQKCTAINFINVNKLLHQKNQSDGRYTLKYAPRYEISPIRNDHFLNVRRTEYLREQLISHIPQNLSALSNKDIEGFLIISLIINCGIACQEELNALWGKIRDSLVRCENYVWLEWSVDNRLVRRFIDVVSLSLLIELKQRDRISSKIPTKACSQILRRVTYQSSLFVNIGYELNLKHLLRIYRAWLFDSLPGMVASACCGELKITHLSKHNFLRVLDGKFVKDDSAQITSIKPYLTCVKQSQFQAIENLMSGLQQILSILSRGLKKVRTDSKQLNRPELKQLIGSIRQKWIDEEYNSLLIALASYAIEKLDSKKKKGGLIRIRTVMDYVRSAGVPLLSLSYQDNWLDLLEDELEQYYLDALNFKNKNKRERLAQRLRFFHDHCMQHYGQPKLQLESLDKAFRCRNGKSTVRASVITTQEYEATHHIIFQATQLSKLNRNFLHILTILIFRFALRISDALSLDTRDILFNGNTVIIIVRANKLGRPKTRAGFRQVVSSNLTDEEVALLKSAMQGLTERFKGEPAAIFSNLGSPWEVFSPSTLSQQLLSLLKHVTGSNKTVIHDARHTFSTAVTTLTMASQKSSLKGIEGWLVPSEYQQLLLGHCYATRRLSYGVASQLGHASPYTTFESYSHVIEIPLDEHLTTSQPTIKMTKLSSWLNIPDNNIRQIKRRTPDKQSFNSHLIKKAMENTNVKVEQFARFDPFDASPLMRSVASKQISFHQFEFIVSEILNGCTTHWLERHLHIEHDIARLSTQTTSELAQKTQIKRIWRADNLFDFTQNQAQKTKGLVDILLSNTSATDELAQIWRDNFIPSVSGLLIGDESQRKRFIELVNNLEGLRIEVRTNDTESTKFHPTVSMVTQSKSYRVNALHRNNKVKAGQIFIGLGHEDFNSLSKLMKCAHRFFFVYSVKRSVYQQITQ